MWFISYVVNDNGKQFKNTIIDIHPMKWLLMRRENGVDARINFYAEVKKTGLKKPQVERLAQLLA